MVKINGSVETSTCASQGRQSRSTRRWSTAFLAVALGLATLGASASFVASTLRADEPREWKGRFGATVATGTLDVERTDAELVAANAADADVTKPKTVYFRDESGKLVKYNYAWLSPADRAEVDFALGLAAATIEETDADDVGRPAAEAPAEAPADEPAEVASSQQATVTLVDGKPVLLLSGGASSAGVSAENSEVAWDANPAAGTRKVLTVNGVEYAFRYCPAGTFTMGSPESEPGRDDDETQHMVELTRGFWMLETEVTVGMWRSFNNATTSGTAPAESEGGWGYNRLTGEGECGDAYSWDNPGFPQTDEHPVPLVNDSDALAFCAWLSEESGMEIRLPTEAEWEYACRAGSTTAYSFGDDVEELAKYANIADASAKRKFSEWTTNDGDDGCIFTAPVRSYKPNAWGFYDMHGNVCEWCADWYTPDFYQICNSQGCVKDPVDSRFKLCRGKRGGSWCEDEKSCRSAERSDVISILRRYEYGFRFVLAPTSPQKSGPIKTEGVTGVVTLDGEPLANATVYFTPAEGSAGALHGVGKTNEKGEYKLQTLLGAAEAGTTPGDYVVTIDCVDEVPTGGTKLNDDGEEVDETEVIQRVPARYLNGATSVLTATVVKGSNTFNFDLTTEEEAEGQAQNAGRASTGASQPSSENSDVAWDAAPKAGTRKVLTVDGVEYAFRYCPAGTFTMGSPEDEEDRWSDETQHEVTLTRGFWTLETEVTQEMYEALTDANPSWFSASGGGSDSVAGLDTSRFPVESVSWEDAQEFIAKLNAGGYAPDGFEFRLPTEAEWEYACRAGTSTAYSWGSTLNGDQANCNGNYPYGTSTEGACLGRTTAVGSYDANGWGLRDMHGNVCEWCSDWYDDYASGAQTDSTGPKSGSGRVLRGGCWGNFAGNCRSAGRSFSDPANRSNDYGFRFVLGYSDNALDAGNNTVAQDSKKVSISGVVTVDGEPVDKGSIRFKPVDGQGPTDGAQIVDGKFEAEVTTGEKILVVDGSKVVGQFEPDPTLNPGVMADKLEMYPGMPFKQEKKITVEKKGQTFEIDYVTDEAE